MSASRRLIVNADDLGRSPGITRGILDAARDGIVTSTTLMMNLPWSAEAASLVARTPTVGVGLHFSFCYGPPLAKQVTSLLGDDGFLNRDLVTLREQATADDVECEARAQLHQFVGLTGRLPTHFDSHQHVHTWPTIAPVIAALAHEVGLPMRIGDTQHRATVHAAGITTPDAFIIDYFGAERISAEHLIALLRALPDGVTELMCHPGYDDDALSDSSYRAERERELRVLTSAEVREVVQEEQIELVDFTVLRSPDDGS